MLVHGTKQRGTSRATIEPEEKRIIGGIVLGGEEEIVHVSTVIINVKIARVPGVVVDLADSWDIDGVWLGRSEHY